MERQRWSGKAARVLMSLVVLAAVTLTPIARVADAQAVRATEVVAEDGGSGPPNETERWWGAAGAALCGAEIRLIIRAPAIGMNPYLLAAGIAGCILAYIDIRSTT